jgi:NAD(P)-dependent dehydrogenase (short-subunit alcohol dehydrogenase family)
MPSTDNVPAGTPIEGAVALVTGGQRGFGRALVDELIARGASKVYATARTPSPSGDDRIVPLALDVTDDASIGQAAAEATDVSILVNNAGIGLQTPVLTAPIGDIRSELETNVFGTLRVARAFSPILARHTPSAMVNVLSVLSWLSFGQGYEMSKAAEWSLTNALRVALSDQGTTVTGVHVGYMDTDMVAHLTEVEKSDPRHIARQVVAAVAAGDLEVLADDVTRFVKSQLSEPLARA